MMTTDRCPACDSERPPDVFGNLCPRCLMGLGLADEVFEPAVIATREKGEELPSALARRSSVPEPHVPDRPPASGTHGPHTIVEVHPEPVIHSTARECPTESIRGDRLRLLEVIARGGMGVIHRGRDPDLNRDVAVKVLREQHGDHAELVRRFIAEAQIAGQLQHPGVVPIHELGVFADRRPYFVMKLVRGQTLAEMLAAPASPGEDRHHLLPIFLQVAQTMAYAHAHGVVHRDLSPSNVMVGKYGEVQVMDWGLAEVVSGGDRGELSAPDGRIMGTPGYLAPERLNGQVHPVDARADVFALGSILCEILSGRPAYSGVSPREGRNRDMQADLAESLVRLESCVADAELVGLVRDCLAAEPARRPRDAGELAARLIAYLAGMAERLRLAELARVEAQARADEEARRRELADQLASEARARADEERARRRLTVALAGSILALVVLGGCGLAWYVQNHQSQRLREVAALDEVERLRNEAATDPTGDPARWASAETALRQARITLGGVTATPLRARLESLIGQIQGGRAIAEQDRRLVGLLEAARSRADEGYSGDADAGFEAAFREAGLDIVRGDSVAVGRAVASRPRDIAQAAVAALDRWAIIRRDIEGSGSVGLCRVLLETARTADPDVWRNALRDALATKDSDALARLASAGDIERRPVPSLRLMGRLLIWDNQIERARAFLTRAWRAYPGDYWINLDLSLVMGSDPRNSYRSLTHLTAAVALRPDSAMAHLRLGVRTWTADFDEAEAEIRQALRIWPDYPFAHLSLAKLLSGRERWKEAADEYRAAIRLNLGYAQGIRMRLGEMLIRLGEPRDGAPEPVTRPEQFEYWHALGVVRIRRGDGRSAGEAFRRAAALAEPGTTQAAEVEDAQRHAAEIERLRAILRGEVQARENTERFYLSQLCEQFGWLAGAAKLSDEILRIDPNFTPTQVSSLFVRAAELAARAGTGPTEDDPPLDAAMRSGLRCQALDWMRAELDNWSRLMALNKPETFQRAAANFRNWMANPYLAGIRDPKALEALPEPERDAWRTFWKNVEGKLSVGPG
jgi:tetratricopeptide (TPR) repeat protein